MKYKNIIHSEESDREYSKSVSLVGIEEIEYSDLQIQIEYDDDECYINLTRKEVEVLRDELSNFLNL